MNIDTKITSLTISPQAPVQPALTQEKSHEAATEAAQAAVTFSVNVNLQAVVGLYKNQAPLTVPPSTNGENPSDDVIEAEYEDVTPKPAPSKSGASSKAASAYQSFVDSEETTKGENVNQYW